MLVTHNSTLLYSSATSMSLQSGLKGGLLDTIEDNSVESDAAGDGDLDLDLVPTDAGVKDLGSSTLTGSDAGGFTAETTLLTV